MTFVHEVRPEVLISPLRFQRPEETLDLRERESVARGEIHVWALELKGSPEAHARFTQLLSPEERERAARYYFERDRLGFAFSRGQMRYLLALYCGVAGAALRFVTGESGKPELAPNQSFARAISFNFTHSAGRALLAVSHGPALGVDLESHDRKTDVLALAGRYFFSTEFDAIRSPSSGTPVEAFFRFWTAKEAVIKAQGTGLGAPLDCFRVDPKDDTATAVESLDTAHIDEGWCVRPLPCEQGWSAALVAKGNAWRVTLRGHEPGKTQL